MKWLLGFALLFAGCGSDTSDRNICDDSGWTRREQELFLIQAEAAITRAQECPACPDIVSVIGQIILADFPTGDHCEDFLVAQVLPENFLLDIIDLPPFIRKDQE